MQLVGQKVSHAKFGKGVVSEHNGNVVIVDFAGEQKKFSYPGAFKKFLKLEDEDKQEAITEKFDELMEERKVEKLKVQKQKEREIHLRSIKVLPESQGAFNVSEAEAADVVKGGEIHTGVYVSGKSKGEPRVPKKLRPNSACIITCVPEGGKEADRYIAGIFMVEEDFYGKDALDGAIRGHEKYRLAMPEGSRVSFWKYFGHSMKQARWGSVDFKYVNNYDVKEMLEDARHVFAGTEKEALYRDFNEYFMMINHF